MTNYNSANVTLINSNGSGDNMVPSGNIKVNEQIWFDTYTYSTASTSLLTTSDTLCIAMIPANRTITSIEVYLPPTFAPTNSAINVGISGSTSLFVSSSTAYVIGNSSATGSTVGIFNKVTGNNIAGFPYVTTAGTVTVSGGVLVKNTTLIYLSLTAANITAPTAGSITTIVRYI